MSKSQKTEGMKVDNWSGLWDRLTPPEKQSAVDDFLTYLDSKEAISGMASCLEHRFADMAKTRESSVRRWPRQKKKTLLMKAHPQLLDRGMWWMLFRIFFEDTLPELTEKFAETFEWHEDDLATTASVPEGWEPPDEATLDQLADAFLEDHSPETLTRLFHFLLLDSKGRWDWLSNVYQRVKARADQEKAEAPSEAESSQPVKPVYAEAAVASQEALASSNPADFPDEASSGDNESTEPAVPVQSDDNRGLTTLDRVVCREIEGGLAGRCGSLSEEGIDEMVTTLVRLNETRPASQYALGLLDAALANREAAFKSSGRQGKGRRWYLAGVLAGHVLTGNGDRLVRDLSTRGNDFQRLVREDPEIVTELAPRLSIHLAELGRVNEAIALSRSALMAGDEAMALGLLGAGRDLNDQAQPEKAQILMESLLSIKGINPQATYGAIHCLAQSLRLQGDFRQARAHYEVLIEADQTSPDPAWLSGLGLAMGEFCSLTHLRLPETGGQRQRMRLALKAGEAQFARAAEIGGPQSLDAYYALGMLAYLDYHQCRHLSASEPARTRGLECLRKTIALLKTAPADHPLLDQALLMQAVLMLEKSGNQDIHGIRADWARILGAAAGFPRDDLRSLLDGLELINEAMATELAERLWQDRGKDMLGLLSEGEWLLRSSLLLEGITRLASSPEVAPRQRWAVWTWVVPRALVRNDVDLAGEGLDQLETLAEESPRLAPKLMDWLEDENHYAPAWSAYDAHWARVRLARAQGDDVLCATLLQNLFYQVRDTRRDEAEQIVELFRAWRLDESIREKLKNSLPLDEQDSAGPPAETVRKPVKVLFIGGSNEMQSQYQARIQETLASISTDIKLLKYR